MAKYKANTVIVDAYKIKQCHVIDFSIDGMRLLLENNEVVIASREMLARMNPCVGDYWVIQADGYVYLNPAEVFERKYSKVKDE